MIKGNLDQIGTMIRDLCEVQYTSKKRLGVDVVEMQWTFIDDDHDEIEHVISWAIRPAKNEE